VKEIRFLLGRSVTALGDLYDRVGLLDGKGAREGHESNPIDINDSGSDDEVDTGRIIAFFSHNIVLKR